MNTRSTSRIRSAHIPRLVSAVLAAGLGSVGLATMSSSAQTNRPEPLQANTTLVVGATAPLDKLTPVGLQQTSMTYDRLIYEPLVLDGSDGTVLPNLASSWSSSNGGRTVTLDLHTGVTFTNGKPFDAAAVIAMLKFAENEANGEDSHLTLAGCTFSAPNSHTVAIDTPTREENALLNSLVTLPIADVSSNLATDPAGTGPYMVQSFEPNVQLTAVAYSHYWNHANTPKIKTVQIKLFQTEPAEIAALQAGAIDVMTYPALNQVATLKSSGYGIAMSAGTGNFVITGSVEAKGSPFDNRDVREALSLAFDRPLFTQLETGGLAQPTCDMWASTSPTFVQNLPGCSYNLSKAAQLIKAAGYSHGFSINIYSMETKWPELTSFLAVYKTDLAKIGVDLSINVQSPSLYDSTELTVFDHNAPGLLCEFFGWGNVDSYFVADYPFNDLQNLSHYSSPTYNNLVHQALAAASSTQANKLYKQLAIYEASDPFVMDLATRPYVVAYNKKFSGVNVDSDGIENWAAVGAS